MYLEQIYTAPAAGAPMQRHSEIIAIAGLGLTGDRYADGTGYYSKVDPCQVTLVSGEDLDRIHELRGVHVHHGEHRRNHVLRGISTAALVGRRFRIGCVLLEYDRPRPPCAYVERLTEPGMTRALGEGAGIAARILEGGLFREGDPVELLPGEVKRRHLP
jgi:MOSC domain-containing protein YiiM